jgi:riboflavin kinase/FMN adenylyltransferase
VGFDFRFGKGRMGDADSLRRIGAELGFDVQVVAEVKEGGHKVSSSRIREAIERGDMSEAARGLGDVWVTDAIVEHGEKRGRELGYPTANMSLGEIVHPAHGVYAVWARIEGDRVWRPAAANFGRTPTTGLRDPLLEVVILDWSGDLYGQRLHTAFVQHLRPEAHYDSLDALVQQMHADVAQCRQILAAHTPPTL